MLQHGCKICGRGNSPAEFCQVASRGEVTVCVAAACSFCFHRPVVRIQTVDVKTSQTSRYVPALAYQIQDGSAFQ